MTPASRTTFPASRRTGAGKATRMVNRVGRDGGRCSTRNRPASRPEARNGTRLAWSSSRNPAGSFSAHFSDCRRGPSSFGSTRQGRSRKPSAGDVQAEAAGPASQDELHHVELAVPSQGEPIFLTITVRTGQQRPAVLSQGYLPLERRKDAARSGAGAARGSLGALCRPFRRPPRPWSYPTSPAATRSAVRSLFSGDQARCSQCHAFRGQGGKVGPDLTEIGRKSRAEIYRSIAAPGAAIEPDYLSYTVATRDGQVVVGLVRAEGADAIRVTDTNARSTLVPRRQIQQIRPSATSIMPIGLAATFGDAAVRDLIAYLTQEPARAASATAWLLSFGELQKNWVRPTCACSTSATRPTMPRATFLERSGST